MLETKCFLSICFHLKKKIFPPKLTEQLSLVHKQVLENTQKIKALLIQSYLLKHAVQM